MMALRMLQVLCVTISAIRTVVSAIKENIRDEAIAVRFGGDEFLIISPVSGEREASQVRNSILGFLYDRNIEKTVPYEISVSIGYVVSTPSSRPDATLQDYIKEADGKMYEIKKEMHKSFERRKAGE